MGVLGRLGANLTRAAYREERIPEPVLWRLAAAGMRDWYRVLDRELGEMMGPRAREALVEAATETFSRRLAVLRDAGAVRADAAPSALFSSLYLLDARDRRAWIVSGLGGAPRTVGERLRARRELRAMTSRARWEEVATHLGELLIVLTERLPSELPHARKILGDVCFRSGARYAEHVRRAFGLRDPVADPAATAMEVLRMSEYVFRVNPEHWSESRGDRGYLEGTACPWWPRPGWNGAHCGIFGRFQSGIASAFGLGYHLTTTIPRHGGHTCRVDLAPIPLGKKRATT